MIYDIIKIIAYSMPDRAGGKAGIFFRPPLGPVREGMGYFCNTGLPAEPFRSRAGFSEKILQGNKPVSFYEFWETVSC